MDVGKRHFGNTVYSVTQNFSHMLNIREWRIGGLTSILNFGKNLRERRLSRIT